MGGHYYLYHHYPVMGHPEKCHRYRHQYCLYDSDGNLRHYRCHNSKGLAGNQLECHSCPTSSPIQQQRPFWYLSLRWYAAVWVTSWAASAVQVPSSSVLPLPHLRPCVSLFLLRRMPLPIQRDWSSRMICSRRDLPAESSHLCLGTSCFILSDSFISSDKNLRKKRTRRSLILSTEYASLQKHPCRSIIY